MDDTQPEKSLRSKWDRKIYKISRAYRSRKGGINSGVKVEDQNKKVDHAQRNALNSAKKLLNEKRSQQRSKKSVAKPSETADVIVEVTEGKQTPDRMSDSTKAGRKLIFLSNENDRLIGKLPLARLSGQYLLML